MRGGTRVPFGSEVRLLSGWGGSAQDAVEVRVREAALGVEALADLLERVPSLVAGRQRRGRLEVHLPPVRTAGVVVHDRLDALEVLVVGRAAVHVHRDVAGGAPVRGGQRD